MFISYLSSIINWDFVNNNNQPTIYTLDKYTIKITKTKKKKIQLDIKTEQQKKSIVNESFDTMDDVKEYINKLSICSECNVGVIFEGSNKCAQCSMEDKYNLNCEIFKDNCMVCLEILNIKNVTHISCNRSGCQYFLHRGCYLKCNLNKLCTDIIDDFDDETFDELELNHYFQVFKCLICKHYNLIQQQKHRIIL